jgi:murein DD-endopeptidase MepM/ murein hydrolase activator NlpD
MKGKTYTFLYVPESNSAVKTLRIKRIYIYLVAAFVLTLFFAAAFFFTKYSRQMRETYKLAKVLKENEVLKKNLDELSAEVATLKNQVLENFDFQKKARLLANLDELGDDVSEVGVGGPKFAYVRSLAVVDKDSRKKISSLADDLDKLLRQTKLQKDSYEEIISTLSHRTELLNSTPSIKPIAHGFISSRFGRRMDPFTGRLSVHRGVDYSVRLGAPIFATADGVVTYARRWSSFGNLVEISHGFGFVTRYAHVSKILVKKGQRVKRGDIIARVGSTGKSTAAHLHYEVLHDGTPVNPLAYVLPEKEITE